MINFIKTIFNFFLSEKKLIYIFLIILAGLYISCFYLYPKIGYQDYVLMLVLNRFNMFYFLIPCFVIICSIYIKNINKNTSLMLRLKGRKQYASYLMLGTTVLTFVFILLEILLAFVFANIFCKNGIKFTKFLEYNIYDTYIYINSLIRLICAIITINFINILFSIKFNNSFAGMLFGYLYFYSILIVCPDNFKYSIFNYINPLINTWNLGYLTNLKYIMYGPLIYYSIIYFVLIKLIMKNIKKVNITSDLNDNIMIGGLK